MTDAEAQQLAAAEDKPWYEDAWDWVVDNGDELLAGALAVGAVALVATGFGAPIGAGILLGMGVSGGLQLATTGEVDAQQLWVSGLAGGLSGGVGAGVAGAGGGLLAQTAAGVGTGAVSSIGSQAYLNNGRIDPGQVLIDSALGGAGGAAGPAIARLRGGLPDPSQVDLASPQARVHILDGDGPGHGGHRWPGQPGKTPFPLSWSDNRIMHNVSDIATDPASSTTWLAGKPGSLYTNAGNPSHINQFGTRDGVPLLVGSHPMGDGINTAFPNTGLPSPEWRRFQELYQDVSPGGFNALAPEGASSYDGQQNR
jgi:hypothetical protein